MAGYDAFTIKALMGHRDMKTTERYIRAHRLTRQVALVEKNVHKLATTMETNVNSLDGKLLTYCELLVGARGFEPPTSRSRTVRSTRLSHAPNSVCDSNTAESRRQKAVGRKDRRGQEAEGYS